MSDRIRARPRHRVPEPQYTLEDLRPFFIQPEQERLKSLEHKLEQPEVLAETIGKILPQATTMSQQQGEALASAMQPLIHSAVHESVRNNPEAFAEAIFPSIGPAIRKAVGAMLESLVQRMDDIARRTLTLESIKWRIEAARTGRPFAEVMMIHNLAYRVEHVFLVHREGAIVLQHVAAKNVTTRDPDQVAAMLTAIDDFARDAFRERNGGLSRFRLGELTGIVERGPCAILIGIVRGVATKDVEVSLAETLERIHRQYADRLAHFKGQVGAFDDTREMLEGCLREELNVKKPKNRRRGVLLLVSIVGLVLMGAVIAGSIVRRNNQRFSDYVNAVSHLPGVAVTRSGRDAGRRFVEGLRDPLAQDPASLLAAHSLLVSDVDLRFTPIVSLDPSLTPARASQWLRPPPGVSLRILDDRLIATGFADRAWIDRARLLATALPGIATLDETHLFETEANASARAAAASLEATHISFPPDSAVVRPAERARLDAAAHAARDLLASAPRGGLAVHVEIVGHTHATEPTETNLRLSEKRAAAVVAELAQRGIASPNITVRGAGPAEQPSRKVTFVVRLDNVAGETP